MVFFDSCRSLIRIWVGKARWSGNRPLSRRLGRCDRVIQNGGDDSIRSNVSSVLPIIELAFSFKHINTFDSDLRPHQSHFNDK